MIDRALPREQKDALIGACDCYVSLHRAEGFGITLAEAMALGKPVIGTGYSGNLDFMTPENSWLVDYELVRIGEDAEPYPADGVWAQPDTDQTPRFMREVYENAGAARERALRGQADIRRTLPGGRRAQHGAPAAAHPGAMGPARGRPGPRHAWHRRRSAGAADQPRARARSASASRHPGTSSATSFCV